MNNDSDLMNDYEKLSLTFEYALILENKYAELKKRLKKYKKELDSSKSDNLKKDAVIASKVDEIDLLEGELNEYKSRCDDLISDLSDYNIVRKDLISFKSDNFKKDIAIASKDDKINFLEAELDEYKRQCRDLNIIIEQKDKHISELDNDVRSLKNEIHDLKFNSKRINLNIFK